MSALAATCFISSAAFAESCPVKMSMNTAQDVSNWRAVNDGVMGGLSSGGPSFQNGHMVFAGVINTNGGGFSSVRTPVAPGALADMTALKLRVKSDGRAYKVTLRTDARYGWRDVSFQTEITAKPKGQWGEVIVPFSDLKATVFGRRVRGAKFNSAKVQSIGIIIADGRDGPFQLDVDHLQACRL